MGCRCLLIHPGQWRHLVCLPSHSSAGGRTLLSGICTHVHVIFVEIFGLSSVFGIMFLFGRWILTTPQMCNRLTQTLCDFSTPHPVAVETLRPTTSFSPPVRVPRASLYRLVTFRLQKMHPTRGKRITAKTRLFRISRAIRFPVR